MGESGKSFAHIINPVLKPPGHELAVAQPVTFESLRRAREYSDRSLRIEQWAATYPEDEPYVPPFLAKTRPLTASLLDSCTLPGARKLPRIGDILKRVHEASSCDYVVYTNVDIAVMPYFYEGIDRLLADEWDTLIINRRTIHPERVTPDDLERLYLLAGDSHLGYDCFVFPRDWIPEMELGDLCVGLVPFDWLLAVNLWMRSRKNLTHQWAHLTFHIGDERTWKSPGMQAVNDFHSSLTHAPIERLRARFGPRPHLRWPHPGQPRRPLWYRAANWTGRRLLQRFPSPS